MRIVDILILMAVLVGCSQEYRATTQREADAQVGAGGFVQFKDLSQLGSREPLVRFGLPLGGRTTVASAREPCNGSAGSVLPPLAFTQCGSSVLLAPLHVLESAAGGVPGLTIAVPGLQNYWVQQGEDYLCWAAAYETVRSYLHLTHIDFRSMPNAVAGECPQLQRTNVGASAFQIAYAINRISRQLDAAPLAPHFCASEQCIVASLSRHRPVIALKGNHAVLIAAVETIQNSQYIQKYWLLDPAAASSAYRVADPLEMCTTDVFIAF